MKKNADEQAASFEEGVDARLRGKKLGDNPHCVSTDEHASWAAGWRATFDLDEDADPGSNRSPDSATSR